MITEAMVEAALRVYWCAGYSVPDEVKMRRALEAVLNTRAPPYEGEDQIIFEMAKAIFATEYDSDTYPFELYTGHAKKEYLNAARAAFNVVKKFF
jgi:hypothetical protein